MIKLLVKNLVPMYIKKMRDGGLSNLKYLKTINMGRVESTKVLLISMIKRTFRKELMVKHSV